MIKFAVITMFPEIFSIVKKIGIIRKAIKNNIVNIYIFDLKKYSDNKRVDDKPYGGGYGMIIKPVPLKKTIDAAKKKIGKTSKVIYLTPQGIKINNNIIKYFSKSNKNIIFICGRYKGIDERIILNEVNYEISIGDYILSGGEIPSILIMDSIIRLIPGVLNSESSYKNDSFYKKIFDFPNYTRPRIFNNIEVPKVLLSGNHYEINKWRLKQSLGKMWLNRPELINKSKLDKNEIKLLEEFKDELLKDNKNVKK
ncbi:tRNA (guanine-N(1)-)-methyltransferase [endosymbiont of Sipalinus gigas]|uniref:tRNA (guanosine(37)-N1)-methyltransferase TrmD n=1 Tax=endosymbiont of Sipalinus gigas TaxID=1972134 RepID=UPI000DC74213|nr:tRNA (guanosine(37)-N1)-methyltransferase TrmD [endosymbiont of Sipalinus gigas]BBA85216.1 tRNA (guanine-N(1)-)-methyltransferase [endosymbiont of Sipalinus gigas]